MPEVVEDKPQFSMFGHGLFGDAIAPPKRGPLADRFIVPPFTVLNAREGAWQERKRAWIGMGIKSELGRGSEVIPGGGGGAHTKTCWTHGGQSNFNNGDGKSTRPATAEDFGSGGPGTMDAQRKAWRQSGEAAKFKGGLADGLHALREAQKNGETLPDYQGQEATGTSIFDPVLCECAYRWFCPAGGQVLDPFAGGSVRGIVAACLGRRYYGIDLRPEQVAANQAQATEIAAARPAPEWACGDSLDLLPEAPWADFLFSCPPYGDLERYSDDPRDLSTMEHHTFVATYKRIILRACQRLLPNRFACFVVGDFRDKKGHYRNFVSDTISAFMEQGLAFYNEAILITQVGSLPIRVGKQFAASRKLGKTHQQVLIFVKGDARKAAEACGDFDAAPAQPEAPRA